MYTNAGICGKISFHVKMEHENSVEQDSNMSKPKRLRYYRQVMKKKDKKAILHLLHYFLLQYLCNFYNKQFCNKNVQYKVLCPSVFIVSIM